MTEMTAASDENSAVVEDILALLPPRPSQAIKARTGLKRLDAVTLNRLRADLIDVAETFGSRPTPPDDAELATRRAKAEAMLAQGFSTLSEVTREIEAFDQRRAAEAAKAVPAASLAEEMFSTLETTSESWLTPVLIDAGTDLLRAGDAAADAAASPAKPAVVLDERTFDSKSVLDLFARGLARQLAGIEPTTDNRRVAEMISRILDDRLYETYMQVRLTTMIRDVLAMIIEQKRRPGAADSDDFALFDRSIVPSSAVDTKFVSATPVVDETSVIEGFAKMAVRVRDYAPDYIFVVPGGGAIAGRLLEATGVGSGAYRILDPSLPNFGMPDPGNSIRPVRIAICDDISRSGDTMKRYIKAAMSHFEDAHVRGMALVGSVESVRVLAETTFFPNIASTSSIRVPWDTRGVYKSTHENHILGAGRPGPLRFGKELLIRQIDRIRPI